jgi:hypothetical protein
MSAPPLAGCLTLLGGLWMTVHQLFLIECPFIRLAKGPERADCVEKVGVQSISTEVMQQ